MSDKEILTRLLELENRLDRHNQYIDSFCGSINDLVQRVEKLENKFKMRGDRLEDIEQAIADLESNVNTLYSFATSFVRNLDQIKDRLRLNDDE